MSVGIPDMAICTGFWPLEQYTMWVAHVLRYGYCNLNETMRAWTKDMTRVKIQFQGMERQHGLYWVKDREVSLGFRNILEDGLMLHSGLSQWCPRGTVGKDNTLSVNRAEGGALDHELYVKREVVQDMAFQKFPGSGQWTGWLMEFCRNQYEGD